MRHFVFVVAEIQFRVLHAHSFPTMRAMEGVAQGTIRVLGRLLTGLGVVNPTGLGHADAIPPFMPANEMKQRDLVREAQVLA